MASLNRQIRSCQAWLPPGWYVAGYYWDIESGGLDLEARSQGEAWQPFAAAGIPRDGGMADLLAEAKSPLPRFAAVVCEDIERSARDTFNALKLETRLSQFLGSLGPGDTRRSRIPWRGRRGGWMHHGRSSFRAG
ncbi:MAG: hypothetical protein ACRDRJ_38955 [Streptosporangiaceae bacterium]